MSDFSFKKKERLSGSKSISHLFHEGKSLSAFPVRILYTIGEGPLPIKVAISVPKRLFKRAVDRNLLKRRIREAYRLNKPGFYNRLNEKSLCLNLVLQYQHHKITDFHVIEAGIIKGMEKMINKLEKSDKQFSE